jgi:hypothetical protein
MGAAEWALPRPQEIDRYREMIAEIEKQMTQLTDDERATIDEATTLLRQARRSQPVFLGTPASSQARRNDEH